MVLIICIAIIAFVCWGWESNIESAVMDKVDARLKEFKEKDDPYQYWDNLW